MSEELGYWEALERPAPDVVEVGGAQLRRGSRVVLRPRRTGGDVFDLALDGRTGVIESIEADMEGTVHVVVTVEDDPGRDLGAERRLGHRFFFSPEEVEPAPEQPVAAPVSARILVAGIGNVFLGDDGFGVAVCDRLAQRSLPAGVKVVDFGIRGMDLAYALCDYDVAILVDAVPRGGTPGSLYLIEAAEAPPGAAPDAHGMDPVKVLALAGELGPLPDRVLVLGCEPTTAMTGDEPDVVVELSEPVRAAIPEAVRMLDTLLTELTEEPQSGKTTGNPGQGGTP